MTPPEENAVRRIGKPTLYEPGCHRPIFPHHWLKQSACAIRSENCRLASPIGGLGSWLECRAKACAVYGSWRQMQLTLLQVGVLAAAI
jgi:hypothetical protein